MKPKICEFEFHTRGKPLDRGRVRFNTGEGLDWTAVQRRDGSREVDLYALDMYGLRRRDLDAHRAEVVAHLQAISAYDEVRAAA